MNSNYEYKCAECVPFDNLLDLRGKTAVVTGGTSGIGLACAKRYAEAGANVVMGALAEEHCAEVLNAGYNAIFVRTDVSNCKDVENLIQTTVETYGSVDILMNAAGIYPLKSVETIDQAFWDKIFSINVRGTFFASKAAAKQMIKQGTGGVIVNTASMCAHRPMHSHITYCSTKSAVVAMTRSLAFDLAEYGIRANSISPGNTATPGNLEPEVYKQQMDAGVLDRIPLHRPAAPDEVANTALFLSSPMANYITGVDIVVDGGWCLFGMC